MSPGCPAGALTAPAALGLGAATCAWSTAPKRYGSLSKCVDACGRDGGVPACPASAAEDEWLSSSGVASSGLHWLGRYQSLNAAEPADGWDYCVDGRAHNYSGFKPWWSTGLEQDDAFGEESCAVVAPHGWDDISCVLPTPAGLRYYNPLPCLCAHHRQPLSAVDR